MTGVLELRDINAGYAGAGVLHGVSLTLKAGSAVAVLGPNGAGKTTLLRVAAGFVAPTSGQVRLLGDDVTAGSPERRAVLGLCDIPAGRAVFPGLTVKENIRLFAPRNRQREAIEEAAERFPSLRRRLGNPAGTMSGGEQQMLALVRAFVTEPKVVLIDEVSLGLAPLVVDEAFLALAALRERGCSILLVEQYVHRALDLADEAHVLNRGRIVFSGTADDARALDLQSQYLASGTARDDRGTATTTESDMADD